MSTPYEYDDSLSDTLSAPDDDDGNDNRKVK